MAHQKLDLTVNGMSCEHCVRAVKGSVSRLAGVSAVEVSLQGKRATVSFDPQRTSLEAIRAAIEQEGYSVSG